MDNLFFYFFEFGTVLAVFAIFFKERKNKELLETLVLAIFYGLLLETLNVHMSGVYLYGKEFLLQVYEIPLAIGLGWAIIYYIVAKSIESYNLKWWQVPFFMALVAVVFDLAIDTVATRLGFWDWLIPLNQEWFGVPYDNLFGWLVVVWTFVFFINLSKQKFWSKRMSKIIKYSSVIISPFILVFQLISFVILAAVVSGKNSLGEIMVVHESRDYSYAYSPEVQIVKAYFFWIIIAVLILCLTRAIHKNRDKISAKVNFFPLTIAIFLHSFFLVSIFMKGFYKEAPILILISLVSLFFHVLIVIAPFYLKEKKK